MSKVYSIDMWDYEVNEERIKKIREEVLKNFSYEKHICLKLTDPKEVEKLRNDKYVKNFKVVNVVNHIGFREYEVEMDKIKIPYLVSVSDDILDGNVEQIERVVYWNCEEEYEKFKSTIANELKALLDKKTLTDEEKDRLEELEKRSKSIKQDGIKKYYVQLKNSIGPIKLLKKTKIL